MSSPSNTTAEASNCALVSLGSNLPLAAKTPTQIVLGAIGCLREISLDSRTSSLYRTAPQDCPEGSEFFINAAMVLYLPGPLSSLEFLGCTQEIESRFSRERGGERNQARTLDIDIISYSDQILTSPELILPHPRAAQREFVLQPLAEIVPEFILPGQGASIAELLANLGAAQGVERLEE